MTEKLQKILSRAGIASRRALEQMIDKGRVTVNGKLATIGDRYEAEEITVNIDGKSVLTPNSKKVACRVLMYHKPEGELTTLSDPENRPTVFDHIPQPPTGRWIYIGRLDINTSGLLLFTTDGELANALMHPKYEVERIYAARIYGDVTDEQVEQLQSGVMLEDGKARFNKVVYQGGEGRNSWYHVSLKEGRKREVRRLWEAVGLNVSRLIRIKYAGINLDPEIKTGQFRELNLSEINKIRSVVHLDPIDQAAPAIDLKNAAVSTRTRKASIRPSLDDDFLDKEPTETEVDNSHYKPRRSTSENTDRRESHSSSRGSYGNRSDSRRSFNRDERKSFGRNDRKSFGRDDRQSFGRDDRQSFGRDDRQSFGRDDRKSFDRDDRKSFDRDDRKSFGRDDRKSFGRDDRKSFGRDDRKSFGRDDRKSFGRDDRKTFGRDDRKSFGRDDRKSFGRDDRKSFGRDDRKSFGRDDRRTNSGYKGGYGENRGHSSFNKEESTRGNNFGGKVLVRSGSTHSRDDKRGSQSRGYAVKSRGNVNRGSFGGRSRKSNNY